MATVVNGSGGETGGNGWTTEGLLVKHPGRFLSAVECIESIGSVVFSQLFDSQGDGPVVWCNATFDGNLCWPPTAANSTLFQSCPSWLNGVDKSKFSTRTCETTGRWQVSPTGRETLSGGWTNYSQCYPEWAQKNFKIMKQLSIGVRIMETCGLVLSLFSLFISIAVFFYFRGIRCDRVRIHRNLFVAVLLHVVFSLIKNLDQLAMIRATMAGARPENSVSDTAVLCQLVICGFEYSKTAMFAWMFIEGFYLHNSLILSVFRTKPNYALYYLFGWGGPALFTAIWTAVVALKFEAKCWFGYTESSIHWIVEIPRIVIIAVNMLFLLNILRVLWTKLRESHSVEIEQARKALKAALVLLPLFGAYNLLGITGPVDRNSPVLFGLWAVPSFFLTGYQGFIMSLLYCFLNSEVQNTVRSQWRRRRAHGFTASGRPLQHSMSSTIGHTSLTEISKNKATMKLSATTLNGTTAADASQWTALLDGPSADAAAPRNNTRPNGKTSSAETSFLGTVTLPSTRTSTTGDAAAAEPVRDVEVNGPSAEGGGSNGLSRSSSVVCRTADQPQSSSHCMLNDDAL